MLGILRGTNPYQFGVKVLTYRAIIRAMVVREIQARYVGTLVGGLWLVIQPAAQVAIYALVFSVGLKIKPANDIPFILFFVCGLLPWLTFQESLNLSVSAITRSPHLVCKVRFPTEILPVISLLVCLVTFTVLLVALMILLAVYGMTWSWIFLQGLYYLAALEFLALGLGWLLSALNVFIRDTSQGVTVVLGLWFWLTPVVWPSSMIPEYLRFWALFNPMSYVVEGFKDTFLYRIPLWERGVEHVIFWGICLSLFFIGGRVFQRLQPDFAEVM